jgi:hypothetical protein
MLYPFELRARKSWYFHFNLHSLRFQIPFVSPRGLTYIVRSCARQHGRARPCHPQILAVSEQDLFSGEIHV